MWDIRAPDANTLLLLRLIVRRLIKIVQVTILEKYIRRRVVQTGR
jgi:hypothetical protein